LILTKHAEQRWVERFSNLCIDYEFIHAKKPKKVALANIKSQCPQHVSIMKREAIYGLVYKLSPSDVVFVCNECDVVITVFPYIRKGDKYINKSRKVYRQGKVICSSSVINKW